MTKVKYNSLRNVQIHRLAMVEPGQTLRREPESSSSTLSRISVHVPHEDKRKKEERKEDLSGTHILCVSLSLPPPPTFFVILWEPWSVFRSRAQPGKSPSYSEAKLLLRHGAVSTLLTCSQGQPRPCSE
jgi:hypothetical protein